MVAYVKHDRIWRVYHLPINFVGEDEGVVSLSDSLSDLSTTFDFPHLVADEISILRI